MAILQKNNQILIQTAGILLGFIYWQTPYDQDGISNINSALFLLMIQISFNTAFTIATVIHYIMNMSNICSII